MNRRVLLTLTSALSFAAVTLASTSARAQTISIANEQSLARLDANGAVVAKRVLTLNPEGVNRQDCLDDQRIRFPLLLAGFQANATVAAWASVSGVDCAEPTNRTGANPLCWHIAQPIPLLQATEVDLPVRGLMSGAPPASPSAPVADEGICGKVDLTTIDVQFLYFAPADMAVPAAKTSVGVTVDTIGPTPPSRIGVLPGDARVTVEWDPPSNPIAGMNVYCEPSPSSLLLPGTTPTSDFDKRLRCGSVVGSVASAVAVTQLADGSPLTNDRTFTFAVSAVDAFGNTGPLSGGVAATPAPGPAAPAGGGGCAVNGTAPWSTHAGALVAGLLALLAVRRACTSAAAVHAPVAACMESSSSPSPYRDERHAMAAPCDASPRTRCTRRRRSRLVSHVANAFALMLTVMLTCASWAVPRRTQGCKRPPQAGLTHTLLVFSGYG